MLTPDQQAALTKIADASVAAERATGCPAELSAAQAIFESGWLSRCPGNNCFGIKSDAHGCGVQYFLSHEFIGGAWVEEPEAFEKYASLADCFSDHARLITEGAPYAQAWSKYQADHDLDALIQGICPIYAKDPSYTAKIRQEAHGSTVSLAVQLARRRANDIAQ